MTHSATPEAQARLEIDRQLTAAGWTVQSRDQMNIFAHRAVAVCEFSLTSGFADYLLIVDKKAIGVVETSLVANLKRAFEGKLVLQDPADESASVLLERIRAGREEVDGRKGNQLKLPGV